MLTPEGKTVDRWKIKFPAQSLNVGPDGTVYVAGDGRVAQFDKQGKMIGTIELPHISAMLKNAGNLRQQAEEQLKQQKAAITRLLEQYKEMEKKLTDKKPKDLTEAEKLQLQQIRAVLDNYKDTEKFYAKRTVDDVVAGLTARLRVINGIAVSKKDIFIVCGETKGYGYAVWRMDHTFAKAQQVLSGLSGCCGQMDVQVLGDDLIVAENTKHQFARYTRDGKAVGSWGKTGQSTEPGCFGGCCNPMNLRATPKGDVVTAESEGIVKLFSGKGDFLALVGTVKIAGGCKNVAVAVSPDGQRVYFCDLPGSRVLVLAKKK